MRYALVIFFILACISQQARADFLEVRLGLFAYRHYKKNHPLNVSEKIEAKTHIKIQGCSIEGGTPDAFQSDDVVECLITNYLRQRYQNKNRPIEVSYVFGTVSSKMTLYWNPNIDGILTEIRKYKNIKSELDSQKLACAKNESYVQQKSNARAETKYQEAQSAAQVKGVMRSPLGSIRIIIDQPEVLSSAMKLPTIQLQGVTLNQTKQVALDFQIDPTDFGNFLVKLDLFAGGSDQVSLEDFIQFKTAFACKQIHVELDKPHAN